MSICPEYYSIKIENNKYFVYFPNEEIILDVNNAGKIFINEFFGNKSSKNENSELREILIEIESNLNSQKINNNTEVISQKDFCPTHVTLCVTQNCNLKCLYCYASGGESNKTIDYEIATKAIDFVISNAINKNEKEVSVGFHGGGEPTVEEELLFALTQYLYKNAKRTGLVPKLQLGTNGVMSDNMRCFICENFHSITISLDGPPEIQNIQRPTKDLNIESFVEVEKTIRYFEIHNLKYGVRSTITDYNVHKMKEIVEQIYSIYPPAAIRLEPVYFTGRAKSNTTLSLDKSQFIDEYRNLSEWADHKKYKIGYSGIGQYKRDQFCSAVIPNFIVTHDGYVTACLEVIEPYDERSKKFFYGLYDVIQKEFKFNSKQIKSLRDMRTMLPPKCNNCYAKYHCAGDCYTKRTPKNQPIRCKINRALFKHILIERFHTGKSYSEMFSDNNLIAECI